MRTKIATVLSIAGVVASGAAAYAVNSTVLSAPSVNPISISTTVAPSAVPAAVEQAAAAPAPSQDNSATPQAQSISSTTTTYQVGNAGSVVVDTASGKIAVTSIAPASGWTSEPARTQSDGSVKVHFVSSTARLEFVAKMVDGKVVVNVLTDNPINAQPLPAAPAPRSEHHDDDDDDDHHEEREHEDGDDD